MRSIAIVILIISCISSFAGDETNIIAASEWSGPVGANGHAIRGRLLIVEGTQPAYGGPKTETHAMTFVELQNVDGASGGSIEFYFDVIGLNCNLSDKDGKELPKPMHGAWGGRGPFAPRWIVLPYNSTIRLFINSGTREPLAVYNGGEPWSYWSISPSDAEVYYLTGTLNVSMPTNTSSTTTIPDVHYSENVWQGKLIFPKMRIPAKKQ